MQYKQTGTLSQTAIATDVELSRVAKEETLASAEVGTVVIESGTAQTQRRVTTIRLLLVDDHVLVREGLRRLLELEEDLCVVGEAVDGNEALQQAHRLMPDVALVDISMPGKDGIDVLRQLVQELPSVVVIMLTMYRQQQHILQSMRSGARGYLLKSASSQEVAQAIRKVHEGGTYISSDLTGEIVNEYRRLSDGGASRPSIHALTEKEIDILRCVATGMSNKEIANQLAYSEKTVKNYLSVIFQKLGIRDRTQAAILALRQGLIPQEEW